MTADLDALLASIAERIAAGETIDPATFPPGCADDPRVRSLLRFARVAGALASNAATGGNPPPGDGGRAPGSIGPWRLVRLLGSGGMGEVWLGERADGAVEHRVAIKRVRGAAPAFAARLESERRILAKLSHPNIARFIDAGVDATGAPWLALDFVDGETLADWVARTRPGLRARLELFRKVCAAVEHAHRLLVVHRDLKPGNVMVDAAGEPRLLDFGIAKLLGEGDGTLTASVLTPAYAAPEQLRGGEVSTATDVYALGLLLFRLLADALPETRREANVAAVLSRLDDEETQRPSTTARASGAGLPYAPDALVGDLDAIVSKAIRTEPEQRYGTVAELAADVQRYLEDRPVAARPPTRAYLASRFMRRHRGALTITALALLGIVASLGIALWQARVAADAARRAEAEAAAARAQAERAEGATSFVLSIFRQTDPFRRDARGTITLQQAFDDALARVDREFDGQPLLAIDLNDDFGETLVNQGRFHEGRARLEKALALAERNLPPDSPVIAETLVNLVSLAEQTGTLMEARPLAERALSILEPLRTSEPVLLGHAKFLRASILLFEGKADAAEPVARDALALHVANLPADDTRLPVSLYTLGMVLRHQRKNEEAKPFLDDAVRRAEALQGGDAAALVYMLDGVRGNANALMERERERVAVDRMLEVARANFSGDHPLHADALVEAGNVRLRDEGAAEGEAMLREAAAMYARLDHPLEARAWRLLGWGNHYWERYDRAAAAFDEGFTRCASIGPTTGECMSIAAERVATLVKLGRAAEALAASEALDRIVAASGTPGLDTTQMADEARAEAYAVNGRAAEGVVLYDELIATYSEHYGADSNIVARTRKRRDEIAAMAP
ncbi:MAG: serine/threonine-protein kinase [Xanthomonadaceae bacterium]|nr:serine/threonine-protein kinase [Xanthomonadaceae bacterium]